MDAQKDNNLNTSVISRDEQIELLNKLGMPDIKPVPDPVKDLGMKILNDISSITGVKYSKEQSDILSHKGGMCVVSCAGSGKTTLLTHLLAKRIKTGEIHNVEKLLVTTYSVAGKDELQSRVNKLLKQLGVDKKVEIRTLHSSYYKLLNDMGMVSYDRIIKPWERTKCLRDAVKESGLRLEEEDMNTLDSLISYQINNMLSDKELFEQYVYTLELPIHKYSEINKAFGQKKFELCKGGKLDYDDLQLKLFLTLKGGEDVNSKGHALLQYCRSMWEHFYIDEFQDISKIQFAILQLMLQDEKKLVVIGDDDQCIYKWRGADPSIILNICGTYDIERFLLSTNYRCAGEIVKRANVGIRNNSSPPRLNKNMLPYNDGGEIKIHDIGDGNYYDMSVVALEKIKKLLSAGVEPENISVLCRNNIHGAILNDMLLSLRMIHRCSEDMRFYNAPVVRDIKVCLELSEHTYNHNLITSNLWKFVPYLNSKACNGLARIMKDSGISVTMMLKSYLEYIGVPIGDDIRSIRMDSRNYAIQGIAPSVNEGLYKLYNLLKVENEKERFTELVKHYVTCTSEFLYKNIDLARYMHGVVRYCVAIADNEGVAGLREHLRMSEQMACTEIEERRMTINLSTMHGAKGKEWEYVIILGADAYSCPSVVYLQKCAEEGMRIEDVSDYIEQERRLHYVAMTRAKRELLSICGIKNISPFMTEALGLDAKTDEQSAHIIQWVKDGGRYMGTKETEILETINRKYKA